MVHAAHCRGKQSVPMDNKKLHYAKNIAQFPRVNNMFPYVGIIQIRLWVKAIQLTLSLLMQAPLF